MMSRINYAAASVGNVVMAFPPMLQAGLTLVGMFAISLWIQWQLALISLLVVPFLYYSAGLYGKRVTPRLVARAGARVAVAVDRARVDGDAPGDRLVRPRAVRVQTVPRAGRAGGRRAREADRAPDDVHAAREHDHRCRDGVRARLRLLPRVRRPAGDREADRAHVVRGGRLPAARAGLELGRAAPHRARGASRIVPAARHRCPRSSRTRTRSRSIGPGAKSSTRT